MRRVPVSKREAGPRQRPIAKAVQRAGRKRAGGAPAVAKANWNDHRRRRYL